MSSRTFLVCFKISLRGDSPSLDLLSNACAWVWDISELLRVVNVTGVTFLMFNKLGQNSLVSSENFVP
jgi:hypothetical protein